MRGVAALVWEAPSGKLLTPPGGHVGAFRGAAITSDGKEVLTSSTDGAILRWEASTGKELGAIKLKGRARRVSASRRRPRSRRPERGLTRESGGLAVYDLPAGMQAFIIPGEGNRETAARSARMGRRWCR